MSRVHHVAHGRCFSKSRNHSGQTIDEKSVISRCVASKTISLGHFTWQALFSLPELVNLLGHQQETMDIFLGFFSHGFQLRFSPLIIPMSQSNDLSEDKWFLLFAYYPVVFMQLPRKTRRSGPCCPPTSRWMLQKRSFASSRCNWNTEGPQEIEDFSGVSLFWMEMPGFPMGFWRI